MKKILFTVNDWSFNEGKDIIIFNPKDNINECLLYNIRKIPTLILDNGPENIEKIEDINQIKSCFDKIKN